MKMISVGTRDKTASIWTKHQLKEFLELHHGMDHYAELEKKIRKVDFIWWSYCPYASDVDGVLEMIWAESEQELDELMARRSDDI